MLASRQTKNRTAQQQNLPKTTKDLEKEMNKSEVIESLAMYFYDSIQNNEKPKRRRGFCTSPSIFNSADFRATSPTISEIQGFIETIFEKRRLAAESGVVALVLFSRAGVKINSSNWMRLILVILLLANKESEDVYSVWNVRFVGIIPNVPVYEINILELEFLKYLKYRLHVERPTYQKFYKKLVALLLEKASEEKTAENLTKESFEEQNLSKDQEKDSDEENSQNSDDEFQQFEEIIISDKKNNIHTCDENRNMSHAESIP